MGRVASERELIHMMGIAIFSFSKSMPFSGVRNTAKIFLNFFSKNNNNKAQNDGVWENKKKNCRKRQWPDVGEPEKGSFT